MIHRFEDLKKLYTGPVSVRYVGGRTATDAEFDGSDESDPRDEFLASSARDEIMQVLKTEPGLPAPDPTPADEAPPATEANPYLDFDLAPNDIAKLQDCGVRPKDAVDAGLTRVTSSESAFHLNRTDTGDLEGILVPYRLLAPGISHCRVILDAPVKLRTSKGKLVPVLQPVASTNHLYYVPGTTSDVLVDASVPVVLCDSEWSALAAIQLRKDGRPSILPVGVGGAWAWRMSATRDDPDGGETKREKGPVDDLKEKIAREGRRVIVAFGSDATKDKDVKSARAVLVKFLKKQKAIVSLLDVPEGPSESRQDLGQWIAAAGADVVAETVQKLLDATSTSTSALTRGYVETEDGIFSINQEGNATFLASPIKVTACTREQEGDNWGRLIEICTPDKRVEKVIIPMAELAAGGTPLAQVLLTLGVRVNPSNAAKDRLAMWIQFQTPESIFVTSRVGWHGKSFVLPGQTIAPPGTDPVLYHGGRVEHHYRQKGALEQWIENVGRLCIGNSRLVFAVALAFAGFLLRIIEQESGGFHFQGLSSIGKTTLLRVAGSVLGGGEKGFIRSWRATSNGLEAVAELHNDSLLCLDELGQVAPEEAGRVAYMLANGTGKTRMSKEIRVRPSMDWRLVFLSTGEISLADHMMTVGRQVHAGQEVRIISIVADASKGMGCFEDLHGAESADQFAIDYKGSANIKASASEQASLRARDSEGSLQANARAAMNVSGSVNEQLSARQSSASGSESDHRSTGRVNEQASAAQASFHHEENAKAEYSDTSTQYHKLVVYADTTKKGAGGTNEVRAKLGEILKTSGLITSFYDINLMGREFPNEDALYHEILVALKQDPNVKPEDCMAVALNRLTPADPLTHRFSAQVTYRVLRVGDGELLLPDKNVAADSGDQVSDDMARTVATELAISKASDILPGEITRALRQNQRAEARTSAAAASEYMVRIDNVTNPGATAALKQALRNAGFVLSTQFRGAAASESITVKLNGKSGGDASAALESQLERYDVVSLDDHAAILKAK